jgi:hypothetical protein
VLRKTLLASSVAVLQHIEQKWLIFLFLHLKLKQHDNRGRRMKVFLSFEHNDSILAQTITSALEGKGYDVWNPETEILPGDNFAEKISDALKESNAMVVLLSPASFKSKNVEWEIGYALGNKSYNRRVIPVLVGPEEKMSSESIPWILRKFNTIRLSKTEQSEDEIDQISKALELAA